MIKRLNTFPFTYKSELDERSYQGSVTMKIPGMIERTQIAVRRSQILGGMYTVRDDDGVPTGRGVDDNTEFTAHVQAWLEHCLVQKPDWLKFVGDDVPMDDGLFMALFKEASKFETTFRDRGRTKDSTASGHAPGGQADGAAQPAEANTGSAPTPVVGREVQAALDA